MAGKEKYAVVVSLVSIRPSLFTQTLSLSRPRRVDEIKIIPQPKKDRRRRLSEEGRKQQHLLVYTIYRIKAVAAAAAVVVVGGCYNNVGYTYRAGVKYRTVVGNTELGRDAAAERVTSLLYRPIFRWSPLVEHLLGGRTLYPFPSILENNISGVLSLIDSMPGLLFSFFKKLLFHFYFDAWMLRAFERYLHLLPLWKEIDWNGSQIYREAKGKVCCSFYSTYLILDMYLGRQRIACYLAFEIYNVRSYNLKNITIVCKNKNKKRCRGKREKEG